MSPQPNLKLAILALGLGAFAIGTSEFAAMGLLPWYAADLGITEPQAGHVVSAYALGVVVGAPITSILGARLPRRRYLAALIALYGVVNLLAAVLPGYATLTGMRFLAGLPHGGYLGVA
ncbi:MFS transporter, partial [Paracoccus sp. (in: a-proteobacteria)]|uniref:MFS transporter n=1 Tax=Paracoccus sp. TaxID=267 RepID=UPI0035AD909D